jgi:hypothetical protein
MHRTMPKSGDGIIPGEVWTPIDPRESPHTRRTRRPEPESPESGSLHELVPSGAIFLRDGTDDRGGKPVGIKKTGRRIGSNPSRIEDLNKKARPLISCLSSRLQGRAGSGRTLARSCSGYSPIFPLKNGFGKMTLSRIHFSGPIPASHVRQLRSKRRRLGPVFPAGPPVLSEILSHAEADNQKGKSCVISDFSTRSN